MATIDELIEAKKAGETFYPGARIACINHVLESAVRRGGRGNHIKTGYTYCGKVADGNTECLIFSQRKAWVTCPTCRAYAWKPESELGDCRVKQERG